MVSAAFVALQRRAWAPGARGDAFPAPHPMQVSTPGGQLPLRWGGFEGVFAASSPWVSRQVAFMEQASSLGVGNHRPVWGCLSWPPSQRDLEAAIGQSRLGAWDVISLEVGSWWGEFLRRVWWGRGCRFEPRSLRLKAGWACPVQGPGTPSRVGPSGNLNGCDLGGQMPLFLIKARFTRPSVHVSIPQSSAEGLQDGVSRGVGVTGGRRFGV